jgi:hypothetical protein
MKDHDQEIAVLGAIVSSLGPLDELGRVRVLGAVALIHGQYDLATNCIKKAVAIEVDRDRAARRVVP